MFNKDTDFIFPMRIANGLRSLRSLAWQNLVDRVSAQDADFIDQAAFTLMMVRINGCSGCSVNTFRGMRGCTQCAKLNVRRYRGDDEILLEQFKQSRIEVEKYLNKA